MAAPTTKTSKTTTFTKETNGSITIAQSKERAWETVKASTLTRASITFESSRGD